MKLKKLLAIFLSAAITVTALPQLTISASAAGTNNENVSAARVWNGKVDTSWFTGDKKVYNISTAEQLAGFSKLVEDAADEDRFTGITINLTSDIILNDTSNWQSWSYDNPPANEWDPIGKRGGPANGYCPFAGTFDGNGHTISGMYYTGNSKRSMMYDEAGGLFTYVSGATIKNLRVEKSVIDATHRRVSFNGPIGIIAGFSENALFESLEVKDCIIRADLEMSGYSHGIGAIVGNAQKVNMTKEVGFVLLLTTNWTQAWYLAGALYVSDPKDLPVGTYIHNCVCDNLLVETTGLSDWRGIGGISAGGEAITIVDCLTKNLTVKATSRNGRRATDDVGGIIARYDSGQMKNNYVCNLTRTDGFSGERIDKKDSTGIKSSTLNSKDFTKKLGDGYKYVSGKGSVLKSINEPKVRIALKGNKGAFSWDKINGAKKYVIYQKGKDGKYKEITSTTKTSVKLDIKKGSSYSMLIRAVMSDGSYKEIGGEFTLKA